jgi:hypothetical protein
LKDQMRYHAIVEDRIRGKEKLQKTTNRKRHRIKINLGVKVET